MYMKMMEQAYDENNTLKERKEIRMKYYDRYGYT